MLKANDTADFWGLGAYTAPEAARLSGVPVQRLRRWLLGRERDYHGDRVFDEPLWPSELPDIDGQLHLSFRDLMETRVVDRFRQSRVSMPYLRKVVRAAQSVLADTHPFSNARLKSDGKRLYVEILEATGDPQLVELLSGQHAFHSIISVGLKDITFADGRPVAWQPDTAKGEVVLDPARSLGRPILSRWGIPTATIKVQSQAGRAVGEIARDFEIDEKAVRAALRFEAAIAA